MTLTVTEYIRPGVFGVKSHIGSTMDLAGGLTFEPMDGATRMSWLWDLQPHGVLRFFGPVIAVMGRRQERRIWTSLKRLLEGSEC
jgi:hypothetical protein